MTASECRRAKPHLYTFLLALAVTSTALAHHPTEPRRLVVRVNERGFNPPAVEALAHESVVLFFYRETDATCAREVVLPEYGVRRLLPLRRPVPISFTTKRTGTLTFICGTGRFRGKLLVR